MTFCWPSAPNDNSSRNSLSGMGGKEVRFADEVGEALYFFLPRWGNEKRGSRLNG